MISRALTWAAILSLLMTTPQLASAQSLPPGESTVPRPNTRLSTEKKTEYEPKPEQPVFPAGPDRLSKKDVFKCDRKFKFGNKIYDCDSTMKQDGEGLRPFIEDVPVALSELNEYQTNRRNIQVAAYVTTFALVATALAVVIGGGFRKNDPTPSDPGNTSITTGGLVALAGMAVGGGAFAYSFSLIKTNESHLGQAVQYYNENHPEKPIEILFSTGITF